MALGRTNTGGGGAGLNFAVKAYASQEFLLASAAKENTIGIVTTAISEWCFSATEPNYPVENMVWIQVDNSSAVAFNMLKKNAVYVYPVSVMQYVFGEWNSVYAYIKQNGAWVLFSEIVTDYFISLDANMWSGGGSNTSEGALHLDTGPWTSAMGMTWPPELTATYKSMVDMEKYETMEVEMSLNKAEFDKVEISVVDGSGKVLTSTVIDQNKKKTVYTLDISGISSGRPRIYLDDNSQYGIADITMIRLVGKGGSPTPSPSVPEGVATFNLNRDANTTVLAEIDGVTYGIENATVNEGPTETTYDFTVL